MKWFVGGLLAVLIAVPALGQQTGSISGKVTMEDGSPLPGVSIQATSNVLPQPRSAISGSNGEYRLPVLPPGRYEVTFTLSGMGTVKRPASVVLRQDTALNAVLSLEGVKGAATVVAEATLLDAESPSLKAAVTDQVIKALPVGQDYRDLVKLVPGVQYTEDSVRGPSAGGSGQDNTYAFDGVNVSLPLFGTLSAEPSSHDIEQVAVVKGGADATDFNRSAGIAINTVSRSGTNMFHGTVSYQIQPDSLIADRETTSASVFEEDKDWIVANLGGPILKDRLFFYASYYAPTSTRENRANLYGEVPDYKSSRDEFFGKLTLTPTDSILLNASYRTSDREDVHTSVSGEASAGSTSNGAEAEQDILIVEGSWIINDKSFLTAKFTDFANPTIGKPDSVFGNVVPALDGSVNLDPAALDASGLFSVPVTIAGQDAYNAFVTPLINRYGYLQDGVRKGGGRVGGGSEFNDQSFYRTSWQLAYDIVLGKNVTHELHVGYQYSKDQEDLYRTSNGWGSITAPGGRLKCPANSTCAGQAYYFQAQVQQQGILNVPTINSQYESHNVELNDVIKWTNLTVNVGLLMSFDRLYGQGLREKEGTVSGFELAPGNKYLMHEIDFVDALQPRVGAVWAYEATNTVYANYARYVPAASSLPRAASWARNSAALINAYFDANGKFMGSTPEASSSGKIFQEDLKPRHTDEYMIGTTRDLGHGLSGRLHARYRYSKNFWEDTNNNARLVFAPPPGIPQELYVPNLGDIQKEIGGSSYVIAALDGAFTKYYEAGLEAEWRGRNAYVRGSYVWSHYYGNFDQDNSTSALNNDANIFIGSSNIADGAGRQLWNFKYGDLRGDRRHQLKLYGYYGLPWNGSVGAYAVYQSGQPWEFHSYEPYISQTTSTSDVNRYAEPAGSRTTDAHYQLDLNYTQTIPLGDRLRLEARVDVFNVFDNQTGYNIQTLVHSANPGTPQSFYDPRRFQFALKLEF